MNYKAILYTLGWVLNIEATAMLLPVVCSAIYGEMLCITVFFVCIAVCLLCGVILTCRPPKNKTIYAKEGFIIVALSWVLISIFGALPFVISGHIPNFWGALFETASGFTTTGASVVADIEAFPRGLVFWRSFTHWIGGMGVLVFLVAILPSSGGSNLYLIKAESPGPSVSKLVPKVKSTAKILYIMYLVLTLIEIVLLLLGGVGLFTRSRFRSALRERAALRLKTADSLIIPPMFRWLSRCLCSCSELISLCTTFLSWEGSPTRCAVTRCVPTSA